MAKKGMVTEPMHRVKSRYGVRRMQSRPKHCRYRPLLRTDGAALNEEC